MSPETAVNENAVRRPRKEPKPKIPEARVYAKYIRISPRKVKIVIDLIRGKDIGVAAGILMHTPKIASEPLLKLLRQAVAAAENNYHMDSSRLIVAECFVCPGPTLKRIMPRAKGSAHRIFKRTSHITLAVSEKKEA